MKLSIKSNIKINKSMLIIVMALIIALLALFILSFASREQPRENLVVWQPVTKPGDMTQQGPSEYSTNASGATLARSNESVILGGAGGSVKDGPQYSYYSRGWTAGGQWWQLSELSTRGYEKIEISFTIRGSNTGPKNFMLEYSCDGAEWLPLTDSGSSAITYSVDSDNKFHQHGPYSLADTVNDLDRLYIRFLNTDAESIAGGPVKSTGTNYIADIIITGALLAAK